MSLINSIKGTIGALTELAIMLLALAIAAQLLVGSGNMSFFGSVVTNVISLVNQLGNAGPVSYTHLTLPTKRIV